MTVRNLLKCDVCGSLILTRTQIGWLDEHPIRINCGDCGILISGTLFLDQKNVKFKFEFKNASVIEETQERIPDYYIEISGELLTKKLQKYNKKQSSFMVPPFFNSLWAMEEEKYLYFKENTIQFLHLRKNDWPVVRRINELWLTGNHKYLAKEVGEYLPKDKFPVDNELEFLRGVHQINLIFFSPITDKKRFDQTAKFLWSEIENLSQRNISKLIELVNHFETKQLFNLYESIIFKQFQQFVEIFPFLLPAFGLKFYKIKDNKLYQEMGITTVSFEELKQFYLDSYEVIGEVISLVVAFNNLKYRDKFEKMLSKRKDVKTLFDFEEKSKGSRIEFLEGREDFDRLVFPYLENDLRNAIGHNSYKYDGVSQLIRYYPRGKFTLISKNIYLLKFTENCWDLYLSLIDLAELVYQTKKIYYVSQGYKPIDPKVFK